MSRYQQPTVRYTIEPGSHVDVWHRFSRDHQDDASAISAITKYCAEHGLIIDQLWGKPAHSGSTITSTAEFTAFVAAMEARPRTERRQRGIVTWKSSRLGRDQIETDYFTALLRRLGYAVIPIADPLTGSDLDPVLESFIRWKDQRLLADISSDVKRTMEWLRDAGYATGGRPPRGFIALREPNQVRPYKHNGEKRISARWVRGGPYEQAVLAAWQMKIAGASDREIHQATHILKDVHCYHDMWLRPCYRDAGYVSATDWEAVQQLMRDRASGSPRVDHPRRRGSAYLLSGLLYCSCGQLMWGQSEPRHKNGQLTGEWAPGPGALSNYICPASKRGEGCTRKRISTARADKAVIDLFLSHILTDDNLAELRRTIGADIASEHTRLGAKVQALQEEQRRLSAAVGKLLDAIEEGANIAVAERLTQRRAELEEVTAQLAAAERDMERNTPYVVPDDVWARVSVQFREVLLSGDVQQIRRILEALIERIDLLPDDTGFAVTYTFSSIPKTGVWLVSPLDNHHTPHSVTIVCPCDLSSGRERVVIHAHHGAPSPAGWITDAELIIAYGYAPGYLTELRERVPSAARGVSGGQRVWLRDAVDAYRHARRRQYGPRSRGT